MNNQTSISIPVMIPAPKFQLFERVRYRDQKGTVVGLYYMHSRTGLLDESIEGWHCVIDFVNHLSDREIVKSSGRYTVVEHFAHEDDVLKIQDLAVAA